MGQFSQQQAFMQNFILMLIETGFSWLVAHDPLLKSQVQKFIEQKTIIKINNYVPIFDIYLQFTPNGVLFDTVPPEQKIDLEVRVSPILMCEILLMGNARSLRQLRIKGDITLKDQFTDLLMLCTLPRIIMDMPRWLFNSSSDLEKQHFSKSRIKPLLDTLSQQRDLIRKLKSDLKQQNYRYEKIQKQNRNLKIMNTLFAIAFIICLIILVFR